MSFKPPEALNPKHVLTGFCSGKRSLDDWLLRHALQAQASGSAKSFVVATEDARVRAYHSLTVGQVDAVDAPERVRKGLGAHPIPVVLLARLAVDASFQGQGLGVGLLKDAIRRTLLISDQVGIRAMLTHPIDVEAEAFYLRFGFSPSPLKAGQLLLLLKDAKKLLAPP